MYTPHVTILIPIKNVAKYVAECLDAVLNQTYPPEKYEVWFLDNFSDDGTLNIISSYPKERVKVLQMGIDSPAIKYNQILPKIKSEVIGFVDGDANVDKEWLSKVVQELADPQVGGASGVIYTANNRKLIPRLIGYELQDRYERMPREIKRVATMHVVYKKKILEEVGGFDEHLKTGYDCEIGYRINEAGYKIVFVPDAKVWHNHRESLWAFFKQQFEYGKFAIIRYWQKPQIAKGDEVTSFWMISQPLFYLASLILFVVWLFVAFPWYLILAPIAFLWLTYIYSSCRLALKFKDFKALGLFIIYLIRPVGWSLGAAATVVKTIFKTKK